MTPIYHQGELEMQKRAGVSEMARRVGNGIHSEIPPAAQAFLEEQPFVVIGSAVNTGEVWASLLTGEPGFVRVLDAHTVGIEAIPSAGDPLMEGLRHDASAGNRSLEVGLLAIEPETRRRMRLNGAAEWLPQGGLLLHTREVYANCPKYIQARSIESVFDSELPLRPIQRGAMLTTEQQEWIANADTFFIASAANGRADASHRGGNLGFVHVLDATTLEFPDYSGNMMFNTLGNLTVNPNAGLLFLDFDSSATLHLTGTAKVIWDPRRAAAFAGAERIVEFHLIQAIQLPRANSHRFRFLEYSRFNPV